MYISALWRKFKAGRVAFEAPVIQSTRRCNEFNYGVESNFSEIGLKVCRYRDTRLL